MFWVRGFGLVVLCFFVAGCSGYTKYQPSDFLEWPPDTEAEKGKFQVGTSVKIQTKDGEVVHGDIQSVGDKAFIVEGRSVSYSHIETIKVKETLWYPTAVVSAGIVVTGILVFGPEGRFSTDNAGK